MSRLSVHVPSVGTELSSYPLTLSEGARELRTAVSPPDVAATNCRGLSQCLAKRVEHLTYQINKLDCSVKGPASLQALLEQGLSLYKENQQQLDNLERVLRERGVDVPASARHASTNCTPGESPAGGAAACSGEITPGPGVTSIIRERGATPLSVQDKNGAKFTFQTPAVRKPALSTPAPSSSSGSFPPISPSLRELQLKYRGDSTGASTPSQSSHSNDHSDTPAADEPGALLSSPKGNQWQPNHPLSLAGTCDGPLEGKELEYLSLETPSTAKRDRPADSVCYTGQGLEHLSLELSPASKRLLSRLHPDGQDPENRKRNVRADSISMRLARGEPAWDMLSLKAAITNAQPGTGQVQRIIAKATFQPQAAAFTALLHMCAKAKLWEKALEIFEAMKAHHPSVINTVHFSSLISACATAGRWEEAYKVFQEMKVLSTMESRCKPNVITYSALMTACCAGGQPEKAHEVFQEMQAAGIKPDQISYSTLIAGFDRHGDMDRAAQIFQEFLQTGLSITGGPGAGKALTFLEQFARKLARQVSHIDNRHESCVSVLRETPLTMKLPKQNFVDVTPGGCSSPAVFSDWVATPFDRTPKSMTVGVACDTLPANHIPSFCPSSTPGLLGQLPDDFHIRTQQGLGPSSQPSPIMGAMQTPLPGTDPIVGLSGLPGLIGPQAPSRFSLQELGPLSQNLEVQQPFAVPILSPLPQYSLFGDQQALLPVSQQSPFMPAMPVPLSPFCGYDSSNGILKRADSMSFTHYSSAQPQVLSPDVTAVNPPRQPHITPVEYQSLPLRFSRQLSLDQLNAAIDFMTRNAWLKETTGAGSFFTADEIEPAAYNPQQATALLSSLLHLKRLSLHVIGGQRLYQLVT